MPATYLTIDDIREQIHDAEGDDNPAELENDRSFSDAEILAAMRAVAIRYGSLQPPAMGSSANPAQLPYDQWFWVEGTLAFLYRNKAAWLARNEIDYSAGGVEANVAAKKIAFYERAWPRHMDEFLRQAQDHKQAVMIRRSMGVRVG